eukprot:343833-Amphidinium_carterae.1
MIQDSDNMNYVMTASKYNTIGRAVGNIFCPCPMALVAARLTKLVAGRRQFLAMNRLCCVALVKCVRFACFAWQRQTMAA